MTDKEFDKAIKTFEKARDVALKLSTFMLWTEDAEALVEQISILVERMKER